MDGRHVVVDPHVSLTCLCPQVILKSCKLLPAMLIGALVLRRRYTLAETSCAIFLVMGLVVFGMSDVSLEGARIDFGMGRVVDMSKIHVI
jgi:hypothetical protein